MWLRKLSMHNLALAGKRVVIRADFNVPIQNGKIVNDKNIVMGLDSIVYALMKEAKSVVVLSHLGQPKGLKNMKYSMAPVAAELDKLLKQVHKDPTTLRKYSQPFKLFSASNKPPDVRFLSCCLGAEIEETCKNPSPGSIFFLENLRFHLEEEGYGLDASGNRLVASKKATKRFRQSLSRLGDIYVNDTFNLTHTTHSSILGEGFETRAAGLLLDKELKYLSKTIYGPKKPFLAILGGIKIIDKIHLIDHLLDRVSELIITGAMAFPFLKKLMGMKTGHSLFDVDGYKMVKMIMKRARRNRVRVHFPVDFISASKLGSLEIETVQSGIKNECMALDIGPESCGVFRQVILNAKLILWNGPPGAFELENFRMGTESVLFDIVKATSGGATSILIGKDTATCAMRWQQEDNLSHISCGKEAAKELINRKVLPGVMSLTDGHYRHHQGSQDIEPLIGERDD